MPIIDRNVPIIVPKVPRAGSGAACISATMIFWSSRFPIKCVRGSTGRACPGPLHGPNETQVAGTHAIGQGRSRLRWTLIGALLSVAVPLGGGSQTVLREAQHMGEVQFSLVAGLGTPDGPGFIAEVADIEHRLNGEWVVTDVRNPAEVKFFSERGGWVRTIGRDGEGPGEFRDAAWLHVRADDGLEVVDWTLSRITSLSPELEVMKTTGLPMRPLRIVFFDGAGMVVISGASNSREIVGLPLHLIDSTGTRRESFGGNPPIREWGNYDKVLRPIARSGTDAVWAGRLTEYVLERWNNNGHRSLHFLREVSWFKPHEDFGFRWSPDEAPNPGIYALHEDEKGLLWVAIRVPDPLYRTAYVLRPGRFDREGKPRMGVDDFSRYYDTVIEVIDPEHATVIASSRMDAAIVDFTRDGLLFSQSYTEDSVPCVEVWRGMILTKEEVVR